MFKHNVFSLLASFTPEELKKLSDFLQSKYFVSNKKLYPLFSYIEKFYPSFNDEKLTKKYLFEKLYPGKAYHDSTIRDLLSGLLDKCEQFLKVEELSSNNIDAEINLMFNLCSRKQYKLFLKKKKILDNYFNDNKLWSDCKFDKVKYDVMLASFNTLTQKMKNIETVRKRYELIDTISIDTIFTSALLIIDNEVHKLIFNNNFCNVVETTKFESYLYFIDELINKYDLNLQSRALINYRLNFLLYKTFMNFENSNNFKNYRMYFEKNKNFLNREIIFGHYVNIINYCVASKRSKEIVEILFQVYDDIFLNKYYITSNERYLNPIFFRSVILFGIEYNKLGWLKNIINKNIDCFEPSIKDKMYNYAMAQLKIAEAESLKSLEYLNNIITDQFIFKIDFYNLKLKVFYLNNYAEETLSLIQTYNTYLNNNIFLSKEEKLIYSRYSDAIKLLTLYKCGDKKIKLEYVSNLLNKVEKTYLKNWLIEEIEKYKK